MACSRFRAVLAIVAVTVVALAIPAGAAVISHSATAPVVDGEDIASLLATPTGADKWWPGSATAYGNPGKTIGQTFTTGSNDVVLDAITFQIRDHTEPTKVFPIRVGTVSGSTFTEIASDSATLTDAWGDGAYVTWTLGSPVSLSANTTYGVDVGLASSTSAWQTGIPYVHYTGDAYPDGTRFRSGSAGSGVGDDTMSHMSGDRVFHLNLEPAGGGGPVIIPVPNGEFAVYKPGTGYSVRGTVPSDIWVQQIGDNRPLSSGTPVDFDDGTSGMVVDIPGWITPRDSQGSPTGTADLFTLGFSPTDGSSCLNAFGAWSGQNGNLAESAAPLDVPADRAGMTLELWAMVIGDVGARTFDLLVDGVALTPDSSVDPSYDAGIWQEISRMYSNIPPGDVTILVGTSRPGPGDPPLFGTRMRVDNIQLTMLAADVIPEPATLSLLGLGALLALRRRRRRA